MARAKRVRIPWNAISSHVERELSGDSTNPIGDLCSKAGISPRSLNRWRSGEFKLIDIQLADRLLVAGMGRPDLFDSL